MDGALMEFLAWERGLLQVECMLAIKNPLVSIKILPDFVNNHFYGRLETKQKIPHDY